MVVAGKAQLDKKGGLMTPHLADSAVTAEKIADQAVSTGKIEDFAVTGRKIADGVIGARKIDYLAIEVDVPELSDTGTALAPMGSNIIGCYPISDTEGYVKQISLVDTTLTIKLSAETTKVNSFRVIVLR